MGLPAAAMAFYHRCLDSDGPADGVKREAAFNLHLLYLDSEGPGLARDVLRDHLTL